MAGHKTKQSKKNKKTGRGHRWAKHAKHGGKPKATLQKESVFSYTMLGLTMLAVVLAIAMGHFLRSYEAPMTSGPENLDVWEWDKSTVATWVRRQGKQYKRFSAMIEQNNLGGQQVLDLLDNDLERLGVAKANMRKKLMGLIKDLRVLSGMEGVMTLHDAERRGQHTSSGQNENPDNTNFGATDKPSFARLNRWLKANGADLHKVYLDPEQRILRTRRKIRKGEVILTLPPNLFMSTTRSQEDSELVKIAEKKMELGTHNLISMYMLEEMKNRESTFWQPYIDVIPAKYEDIPIFWKDNEISELQGDALARYKRRRETLSNDYDNIVEACPGFKETATLEEFMWARTAVITRTFGLRVKGVKITSNLPIDFVMHANKPDTTWGFRDDLGCYHITAVRDIPKNKFLTITYGKKANARFLVNYGFCLPQNSRNKGFIELDDANSYGLDQPDNVRIEGEKWELEITTNKVDETIKRSRQIVKEHCRRSGITDGWEVQRISWEYLLTKCAESLKTFPTTLAFDFEQLKRDDLSQNIRNAILARSGEKYVVDFYLRLADAALSKLEEFSKAVSEIHEDPQLLKTTRNKFAKEMFALPRSFTEQNLIVDEDPSFGS